jgi:hypothetical protein
VRGGPISIIPKSILPSPSEIQSSGACIQQAGAGHAQLLANSHDSTTTRYEIKDEKIN